MKAARGFHPWFSSIALKPAKIGILSRDPRRARIPGERDAMLGLGTSISTPGVLAVAHWPRSASYHLCEVFLAIAAAGTCRRPATMCSISSLATPRGSVYLRAPGMPSIPGKSGIRGCWHATQRGSLACGRAGGLRRVMSAEYARRTRLDHEKSNPTGLDPVVRGSTADPNFVRVNVACNDRRPENRALSRSKDVPIRWK